jgi:hypothetical protein
MALRLIIALLLVVVVGASAVAPASPASLLPVCAPPSTRSDCAWPPPPESGDGGPPSTLLHSLTGVSAPRRIADTDAVVTAPPAVVFQQPRGSSAAAPSSGDANSSNGGVELSNVVLVGFEMPDPATQPPETALRPRGLVAPPLLSSAGAGRNATVAGLALRDVRILVTPQTLDAYVAFFNPDAQNASAVPNARFVWTDRRSFLHVNSWFNAHTEWTSVGLLVADGLDDALATSAPPLTVAAAERDVEGPSAAARPRNYVLAADNATIVPQLETRCPIATPRTLLVYLSTNVTLGKPPVPKDGIDVLRPLVLAGRATAKTSIDFRRDPNQVKRVLFLFC